MDNYVQQMWRDQSAHQRHGKGTRVFAWIVGIVVVIAAGAAVSQPYWYPYISSYL